VVDELGRLPMIGVALNAAALPMAVAGCGAAALRRLRLLRAGGAAGALLFTDQPAGLDVAGIALRHNLPTDADLAALSALWIVGLPDDRAAELAAVARAHRVLVNVEDRPALCDFHSVAEVRRGDLLLTVSTGGASPGLAARIRARLASEFGPEWADRLTLVRDRRRTWRRTGRNVAAETDALLQASGWLT
jgi:precorrin-2 dehydrogenase/sirohydrochlorin ferrochelatase